MRRHIGLQADKVIETIGLLRARISERFPDSGLARTAEGLVETARTIEVRARRVARPYLFLRLVVFLVIAAAVGVQAWVLFQVPWAKLQFNADPTNLTQALGAAVNLLILAGAATLFLVRLEERIKRGRALKDLHELRSLAHVVDMHQLTKDPTVILSKGPRTVTSPTREMTQFQLTRYLEYCAEMLALLGKLAALYSEYSRDTQVIEAVNDIETLCADLGRKIWQKITILSALDEAQAAPTAANSP